MQRRCTDVLPTTSSWPVGEQAGFLACYQATFNDLYRFVASLPGVDRSIAEDIVQDVYLATLSRAVSGRLDSVTLSYLKTAGQRRHLDLQKSRQREQLRMSAVATGPATAEAMQPEATGPLLAALNDRQRRAVHLRYLDDLPVGRVASRMGLTVPATESILARARKTLRREADRHE